MINPGEVVTYQEDELEAYGLAPGGSHKITAITMSLFVQIEHLFDCHIQRFRELQSDVHGWGEYSVLDSIHSLTAHPDQFSEMALCQSLLLA